MTHRDKVKEYIRLKDSTVYTDKLRAAALKKEFEGDMELSEAMNDLAEQMETATDDDEFSAIVDTRQKLHSLIEKRRPYESMFYHCLMSDDEVIGISSGEVTNQVLFNEETGEFDTKGSQYDHAIFGGDAEFPIAKDGDSLPEDYKYGRNFGHIVLNTYVMTPGRANEAAMLLKMDVKDVIDIAYHSKYIITDDIKYIDKRTEKEVALKAGTIVTEAERLTYAEGGAKFKDFKTGSDPLHTLLERMNYPGKPERIFFKVLPVIPPCMRVAYQIKNDEEHTIKNILPATAAIYNRILHRNKTYKRLLEIEAPSIIQNNEGRMLQEIIDILFGVSDYSGENIESYDLYGGSLEAIWKDRDKFSKYQKAFVLMAKRFRIIEYTKPE